MSGIRGGGPKDQQTEGAGGHRRTSSLSPCSGGSGAGVDAGGGYSPAVSPEDGGLSPGLRPGRDLYIKVNYVTNISTTRQRPVHQGNLCHEHIYDQAETYIKVFRTSR